MIVYFDTSAFIPLIIDEPNSDSCERLWNEAERVVSVRLIYVEARAALARAQRLGRLTRGRFASAVALLDDLSAQIDHIEITDRLVRSAGALVEEQQLSGYDAVHLAAAQAVADRDTVFASGDQQLTAAASHLGLMVAPSRL
ncbi:type II toxin-antitoxin system VapC family toxin [Candidatus Poriferisocius sp.]|uniref:type II toxin-antitoxin system VapC family toxin n=1 Tax=Candidatus Poriferisocius sp. TaxID=3101276 RepID=UPI003B52C58B